MKIYFKTKYDQGGVYFKNDDHNIMVRFAGKPKFILEGYIEKYGREKGMELYQDLLDIIAKIKKSPLVLYLDNNTTNDNNKKENSEKDRKKINYKSNRGRSKKFLKGE